MVKVADYIIADPFSETPIEPDEISLMVNREEEKERIQMIIDSASKGYGQNIAILGKDGIGKTSIMNYVEAMCRIKSGIYLSRINITTDTKEDVLVKSLVKDLLEQVNIGLGNLVLSLVGIGKKEQLDMISKGIKGISIEKSLLNTIQLPLLGIISIASNIVERKGRPEDIFEALQLLQEIMKITEKDAKAIIVLLDEAGYVAVERSIHLLQRMKLLFQRKPFMLCIAGSPLLFRKYSKIEPTFVNLFPEQNRFHLSPLKAKHIRELIKKRLAPVRKKGKGVEPFENRSIETLYKETNGNPRYIIRLASYSLHLAKENTKVKPEHIIKASDKIYQELGRDLFERLSPSLKEVVIVIGKFPNSTQEEIRKYLKSDLSPASISLKIRELESLGYIEVTQIGREKRCVLNKPLAKFSSVFY